MPTRPPAALRPLCLRDDEVALIEAQLQTRMQEAAGAEAAAAHPAAAATHTAWLAAEPVGVAAEEVLSRFRLQCSVAPPPWHQRCAGELDPEGEETDKAEPRPWLDAEASFES